MYLINVFVKNAKPNVKFPRMDALFIEFIEIQLNEVSGAPDFRDTGPTSADLGPAKLTV